MSNSSYLEPFVTTTNLKAQAITLPIFSALSTAIIIIPFVWHYRNKNVAACILFAWLILSNIFTFVNAIIWPNEDFASWWNGHGLCDIEAKLDWPIFTGIPCSVVCIVRNLAKVLRVDRANLHTTKQQRRRMLIIDCLICFLVPFLQVVLHYCIQPNRYIIVAVGGCAPSFDESWPTIVLMYIWPQIFALVACYYCVLIIIRLRRYRSQFAHILEASNSNLTTSRFLRLFLMSFIFVTIYTPVSLYLFYVNLDVKWYPYSWSFVHDPSTWDSILYLPFLGIRTLDRWLLIVMSVLMFFFFGMGSDAVDIYRTWLNKLGFARIWPSLALPRSRQGSTSSGWTGKFSLVARAKKYFEERASRKGSGSESSLSAINKSRSDSTTFSLSNLKASFSTTTTEHDHLSGAATFASYSTQPHGSTSSSRRTTLPVLTEHPSSQLPDFHNPFADLDPEAQSSSSFPGISGTATSRHANGGIFGGHQGSPFNLGLGSLPSMKFSPMNLFPSLGWKRWSRATTISSPVPQMNHSPSLTAKAPTALSKAEERARSDLTLASQYRDGVVPALNSDWGRSPEVSGTTSTTSTSQTKASTKGINPLHSNPSLHLKPFPPPTTSQQTGLQTNIYSSRSKSRDRERIGSASSENSVAQSEIEKGVIQVRRKMQMEVEGGGGGGGIRILKRDSVTGGVYEE